MHSLNDFNLFVSAEAMASYHEAQSQECYRSPYPLFKPSNVAPEVLADGFKKGVIDDHPDITIQDYAHMVNKLDVFESRCEDIKKWVKECWYRPPTQQMLHEFNDNHSFVQNFDLLETDIMELVKSDRTDSLRELRVLTMKSLEYLKEKKQKASYIASRMSSLNDPTNALCPKISSITNTQDRIHPCGSPYEVPRVCITSVKGCLQRMKLEN